MSDSSSTTSEEQTEKPTFKTFWDAGKIFPEYDGIRGINDLIFRQARFAFTNRRFKKRQDYEEVKEIIAQLKRSKLISH